MGKFKVLYDYCQTLEPKISRRDLEIKTLEITGVEKIKVVKTTLDISVCRGFFVSAKNTENRFVQMLGCDVIVLARGQKYCWDRFVYTKELMHLFDNDDEPTDSEDKFEKLLTDLEVPSAINAASKQVISEYNGFWMALACLCPEVNRLEFESLRDKKHIDDYSIALKLRIPEQYVPLLFQPRYKKIVDALVI